MSSGLGWQDCMPSHAHFWESWGCSFLRISLLGYILRSPTPCPRWAPDPIPASSFSNGLCRWRVSKKDVPTRVANILFSSCLSLVHYCERGRFSSASPCSVLGHCGSCKAEGRVEDQEHEQWVSIGDGTARASNITGGGSSEKYSLSCRWAELGPYLGQNKISVQLGAGLVPTACIVPVYIKAALPQYC